MQIERLFKIVLLLLNDQCRTAKEIADQCAVSVRTIQRDLDTLSLAGIPVFSTRGYSGGVGLLKSFTLDKTFLTEQEQADILHGLETLKCAGYPGGSDSLLKLAAMFHKKAAESWLRVDFSSWCGSGFGKEKFARLKESILSKKVIRFTYYDSENRISEKTAEPLCMLFRERAWYLCVFDRSKNREIIVRASRMRNIEITEETFVRTMTRDPMETPDYARSYDFQRVILHIDARHAFRAFDEFPEDVIHEQADGSFVIDEAMPVNEWLTGYLLSFAEGLEVIEPAALRTALKEKISLIQKKYDNQLSGSSPIVPAASVPDKSKAGDDNGRIRSNQDQKNRS